MIMLLLQHFHVQIVYIAEKKEENVTKKRKEPFYRTLHTSHRPTHVYQQKPEVSRPCVHQSMLAMQKDNARTLIK